MTAYDLRPAWPETSVTADGRLCPNFTDCGEHWDINESSILTKLIQETGRFAERYASDLFIDWQSVSKYIESGCTDSKTWFFGIRKDGVDHEAFINSRMDNDSRYWYHNYRKIYRLDAIVESKDYGYYSDLKLTMTLKEVSD